MSFWAGKKVLVTGGAGFIGSHTVELLLSQAPDVRVVVPGRFSGRSPENLAAVASRIHLEEADLRRPEDCARVCRGVDVVLNVAGRTGGIAYNMARPATLFRDNIRISTNMIEAAQAAKVERFLVVSSACVYSRECPVPTPESEGFSGRPEPTNEGYGWAKRMAEFEAMAAAKEFGLKVAIARPYNAYGPRDHFDPEVSHVIAALIRKAVDGEDPVRVWGEGKQTRAFLFVEDCARGLLETAERYAECDPVNLGSEEEVPVAELARLIVELSGTRARLQFEPEKPSGYPRRSADISKALAKVGFKARVSLREGLKRTIDWYAARSQKRRGPPEGSTPPRGGR